MFFVLKACFLLELICMSSCETSRIKRASSTIIDLISKLVPSVNKTVVFDGPVPSCCKTRNPPATCEPCKVCPPLEICESCSTCPPEKTCETCSTCPPPVTCETSQTCPESDESRCLGTGSFYCPDGQICFTTLFGYRTYNESLKKCASLSQSLSFQLGDKKLFRSPTYNCILKAIPAMKVMHHNPIWVLPIRSSMCSTLAYLIDEDEIIGYDLYSSVSCEDKRTFYCFHQF